MFRSAPEGDELQMNMVTISKELNDLMVTEEKEQVANYSHALPNSIPVPQSVMSTVGNLEEAAQYVTNICYQQQGRAQFPPATPVDNTNYGQRGAIAKHNLSISHYQGQQYHDGGYYLYPSNSTYPIVYPGVGYIVDSTRQHFNQGLSQMVNQSNNKPKCEFHYLSPQTDTGKVATIPLLSITANGEANGRGSSGCFRKQNRTHLRHNFRSEHDYDKIIVNLSSLNISQNGKESNPVLRLFACFRNLHNALAEVPPLFEPYIYSAYEPTFAPMPKVIMPCTMNVQYQVKYASRKLASFFSGLAQIVANNRMYEQNISKEFDQYLYNIQTLLSQFELYKRLELEHKRGQFVSEDIRVHAERLEILVEKLTQLLREVHLRVIAYDWYIGIKYLGKYGQKTNQTAIKQHSKIGVINEILQMCNMASSETIQPAGASAKAPDDALDKPIIPKTSASSFNTDNSDIQSKQQMNIVSNRNNDSFGTGATFAETATAFSGGLSKCNSNARQPVFYIG